MKILIMIILASFGCANNSKLSENVKKMEKLNTEFNSLNAEINQKKKEYTREELTKKQEEVVVLKSKMQTLKKQIDDTPIQMTYKSDYVKSLDLPSFKLKGISQLDKKLEVKVHYSGGCGKNHDFELITNGKLDKNGVLDFYLVDNTKGDNCKMLLMETKIFDIAKVASKNKISGFRINDTQLTSFARSK